MNTVAGKTRKFWMTSLHTPVFASKGKSIEQNGWSTDCEPRDVQTFRFRGLLYVYFCNSSSTLEFCCRLINDFNVIFYVRFGDRVKTWLTLSDPQIEATKGYDTGEYPPSETVRQ